MARTLNDIGRIHEKNGKPGRALRVYGDALRVRMETLGPDHLDVAHTQNNMGVAYYGLWNYGDALAKHTLALGIIEKTFGVTTCDDVAVSSAAAVECTSTTEHGIIIRGDTYKNIGSVLLRKCEFTEAKDNFTKALELYRSMNLKEDDPRIAVTLDGILRVEHEEELCV